MKTLHVSLADRSYPIYIGEGLLAQQELLEKHIKGTEVLLLLYTLKRSYTLYRHIVVNQLFCLMVRSLRILMY